MGVKLPNGSVVQIAMTSNKEVEVTDISNAKPAIVTAAGHGYKDGDIVVLKSAWIKLNDRAFRVSGSSTDTFELEGLDTTREDQYPEGEGKGTVYSVDDYVQISQVTEFTTSGGDQNFTSYTFLEEGVEHQIPTYKGASSFSMTLGDDTSLPWYDALSKADDDRDPRIVTVKLPNKSLIIYNCYVTLNKTPSLTVNEIMTLSATFSMLSEITRYAS